MTAKWILIAIGVVSVAAVASVLIGQASERSKAEQMATDLLGGATQPRNTVVSFDALTDLPPPVARYFRHVLVDGQQVIHLVRMQQSGVLRTSTAATSWSSFNASQVVVPPATGFLWNAKIEMPLGTHVRVLDSYSSGVGSGRASLLSAFAIASETGVPELNSGALHRYLAEAVWFPTALLPQSGVSWSSIDDFSALATLADGSTTVSLEFRFNDVGEVTGIYSDGRFGRFDGTYRRVPWEGRFRDYQTHAGMRVPFYGEVGWYDGGVLLWVWKGDIIKVQYEFEP
ncbi:DUF6544 family protein [Arsukibacterium sp.]|uniref:DUF6544 family protein n=1 Tax=Arsukibacterium sp. TaxID=1977258 RepID=UPI002FD9379A